MISKVLTELEFNNLLNEAGAQTQTGAELINKFRVFLMSNEVTHDLVNAFVREAQKCSYDNGVNIVLEQVSNYINNNKTLWALASTCESINNNSSSYNYLNRNAAKHVEKILEMNEDDCVKYIKAGALKNVMYCESFRNIIQQVYKNNPIIESKADYMVVHPVSMIESIDDIYYFEVNNNLYKINEDQVEKADWVEVSNTFRTISTLLESNICHVDGDEITINLGDVKYTVEGEDSIVKEGKEGSIKMDSQKLRENNRLTLMATNPNKRNYVAGILEAVALLCEHYNKVVVLENVGIYTTKNDQFMVIESGKDLYATLLKSNHNTAWEIKENALDVVTYIKKKTNVMLNECYKDQIDESLKNISTQDEQRIQESIKSAEINGYRQRIENLTKKFQNDPVKLAILSKLAKEINENN